MAFIQEDALDDVLGRLTRCATSAQLLNELRETTDRMGFQHFSYYILQPPEMPHSIYVASNYPDPWKEYYREANGKNVDPVMQAMTARLTPFLWEPLINSRHLTDQQTIFCNEAQHFGVITGGSIPLRGPGRCIATVSVSSQTSEHDFSLMWAQKRHLLHILAAYAHERLVPLIFSEKNEEQFSLSPRERECLLWTARGKSAWSIGEILNISQSTVEEYLLSACRKLGVKHRIQAVVVAIMNGLIVP